MSGYLSAADREALDDCTDAILMCGNSMDIDEHDKALYATVESIVAQHRAAELRAAAGEWKFGLRRDAALYDYGRWLNAAAHMLRDRADRIEATS